MTSSIPIGQVGAENFPCHPRYFELVESESNIMMISLCCLNLHSYHLLKS